MLHHEDNPEEQQTSIPAAEARVTPEELAAALARLEARKEVGERHLAGTLPLGEAVQQLGLDATPEELWREVQAGRAQASQGHIETHRMPRRKALWVSLSSGLALGLLIFMGGFANYSATHPDSPSVSTTISIPAAPQPAPITIPANLLVRRADGKMVLLSEVGENQPVQCSLTATGSGASFAPYTPGPLHWTLLKHGGQVYLRGWIADMSDTALRSSVVEIHSERGYVTSGLTPLPVTLPVAGFLATPGLTTDDMISGQKFHLDSHFREKW